MKKLKLIALLIGLAVLFSGCINRTDLLTIDMSSSPDRSADETTTAISAEEIDDETTETAVPFAEPSASVTEETASVTESETNTTTAVTTTTTAVITTTAATTASTTTAATTTAATTTPAVTTTTAATTTAPVTTTTEATTSAPKPESFVLSESGRQKMLSLINKARAEAGLAPMTLDATADTIAQQRATELVISYNHTRPDGSSFVQMFNDMGIYYGMFGENIAYGMNTMSTVEEAFEAWMNSSGHRANILSENYTCVGVGMYSVEKNGNRYYYWCQIFSVYY